MPEYYICSGCGLPIKMGPAFHTTKGYFHETCRPRYYLMNKEYIDKHSFENWDKAGRPVGQHWETPDEPTSQSQ